MVWECGTTEKDQAQRVGKGEGGAAAGGEGMVRCGGGKDRYRKGVRDFDCKRCGIQPATRW